MEGGHDVGGPGLTDVLKAYGVVRTVPAPGLFAKIHGCIVFRFSNFSHTVLSPLQAPHSFAVYDWCCLPPFRLAANRGMRPGGYATFWWQPTHAARAETACGLCRARRRKTSAAKLKAPKPLPEAMAGCCVSDPVAAPLLTPPLAANESGSMPSRQTKSRLKAQA